MRAPLETPGFPAIDEVRAFNGALRAYANGVLQFANASPKFKNMRLATSDGGHQIVIKDVATSLDGPRYLLDYVSPTETANYCSDEQGAMVVAGSWDRTGLHHASSAITFACDTGVVRKCFTWGFHPPDSETTGLATDPWTAHQACTRMARADYCSVGETHTMEETAIVIRDRYPGAQPNLTNPNVPPLVSPTTNPAPPDRYWFEAAWRGGSQPVTCLAKERWASLPLGGTCPGIVDDPRTVANAQFCEDYPADLLASSSVTFNSSKVGQLYLNRWSNGTDELVTVRGVAGTSGRATSPLPGYIYKEAVGLLMRNPPASLVLPSEPNADLATLELRHSSVTNDYVVSLASDGSTDAYDTEPDSFEGYVYVANPDGAYLELNLYKRGTDFVSATHAPSSAFQLVRLLGYIDPP